MPLNKVFNVSESGEIREEFVKFVYCEDDVTGGDVFEAVSSALNEFELDLIGCRGEGYGGVGCMSA